MTLKHLFLFLLISIYGNNISAQEMDTTLMPVIPDSIIDESWNEDENNEDEDVSKRDMANAFDPVDSFKNSNPVKWRELDKNHLDQLKNDTAFSYVKNGIPQKKPKKKNGGNADGFRMDRLWLYIAIVAFAAFIVWYLRDNNISLFRKKGRSIFSDNYTEDNADIFALRFPEAINNAVKNKNYRLAIRLQYLQLLKKLSEAGIIQYQPDKTNHDYLVQLRPTTYYKLFSEITRNYEYSWYGLFNIDEQKYQQVSGLFHEFNHKI